LLVRLLRDLSEPADDPLIQRLVALGDVVADVGEELAAVARARLDREAPPEVEVAAPPAGRGELDALVLAPPGVPEPVFADRGPLRLPVHGGLDRVVEVPRLERLDPDQPERLAVGFELHHRRVAAAGEDEGVPLVEPGDPHLDGGIALRRRAIGRRAVARTARFFALSARLRGGGRRFIRARASISSG